MVKWLLCAALTGCAVDGVVLVVAERTPDATVDVIDAAVDGSIDAYIDATLEASSDAFVPEAAAPTLIGACRINGAAGGFYESFPDTPLDPARWLLAEGPIPFDGVPLSFSRANVAVEGGNLTLRVRGARAASGPSAAAIATRDLFASGTYQVQGRVAAGVSLSVWWRRDDEADGTLQIASPGLDGQQPSFARVLMRSSDGANASENQLALGALDDGATHIWRFDRYTTGSPAARFWVDDTPRWNTTTNLPSARAGRLWIVASPLPGAADFDTAVIQITNTFITPFGNAGDRCTDGELRGTGLAPP